MSEDTLHKALVSALRRARIPHIHLPNAVKRSRGQRSRALVMGATSPKGYPLLGGTGFPDLLILGPRVCAIELKSPTGRTSQAQRAWLAHLAEIGIPTRVSSDLAECLEWLREQGYPV